MAAYGDVTLDNLEAPDEARQVLATMTSVADRRDGAPRLSDVYQELPEDVDASPDELGRLYDVFTEAGYLQADDDDLRTVAPTERAYAALDDEAEGAASFDLRERKYFVTLTAGLAHGMTQEQIGELLGVTGGAVGRYFRAFSQDGYFDRDGPRQDPEYTVSDDAVRLASEFVSDADAVDYPVQEDTLRDIAAARDIDVPLPDAARQEPSPADDATAHESEGYEVADPDEVPSGMRQAVALAAAEIADGHDLSEAADPDTLRDGRAWLDDQGYTDWEAGKLAAAFADEIEPIDLTDGPTPEPHRPYQPRNATKAIKHIFDPDTLVMGRNYRERIEAAAADTPVTPDEVLALPDVSARTLHDRFGLSWDEEEHVPLLHIAEEIAHDRDIEPVVPHLERDDDGVYVVDEEWR